MKSLKITLFSLFLLFLGGIYLIFVEKKGAIAESDDLKGPIISILPVGEYCVQTDNTLQGTVTYIVTGTDPAGIQAISFDSGATWSNRDGSEKMVLRLEGTSLQVQAKDTKEHISIQDYILTRPCSATVFLCFLDTKYSGPSLITTDVGLSDGTNTRTGEIAASGCATFPELPYGSYMISQSFSDTFGVWKIPEMHKIRIDQPQQMYNLVYTEKEVDRTKTEVAICARTSDKEPLIGQTVYLTGEIVYTGMTQKDGCFLFTNIIPDVYVVGQILQDKQEFSKMFRGEQNITKIYGQSLRFGANKKYTFTFENKRILKNVSEEIVKNKDEIGEEEKEKQTQGITRTDLEEDHASAAVYITGETIASILASFIDEYTYTRSICKRPNTTYSSVPPFVDILGHKYEDAILDIHSYCIIHGTWRADDYIPHYLPDDAIVLSEAMKMLVNTVTLFKGRGTITEDYLYHKTPYVNLTGYEWFSVYIPAAQKIGFLQPFEKNIHGLLFLDYTKKLTEQDLLTMVYHVGAQFGLEQTKIQGYADITTRGGFAYLLTNYFAIQGDAKILTQRTNNLTYLIALQKKLVELSPQEQIMYFEKAIGVFDRVDATVLQKAGITKKNFLQVLRRVQQRFQDISPQK